MAQEIKDIPVLICLNKIDLATREHLDKVFQETRRIFEHEEIMKISSKTGTNVQELLQKITARLDKPFSN
jgi:GTPase Era involved in 16S rRNA processing